MKYKNKGRFYWAHVPSQLNVGPSVQLNYFSHNQSSSGNYQTYLCISMKICQIYKIATSSKTKSTPKKIDFEILHDKLLYRIIFFNKNKIMDEDTVTVSLYLNSRKN